MSTKKKFIIALCAVSVVAVTLLASLIAVVATFNAKTTAGGFKVSYTAKNVHATIAAEYTKNSESPVTIKSGSDNLITFTGTEVEEEVTKSFDETNLTIGKDDVIVLHYTITNTDSTGATTFKVVSNSTTAVSNSNNMTVKYSDDNATWVDSIGDLADADSVAYGTPLNLYIQISVATKTQSATFEGQFNFELIVNA